MTPRFSNPEETCRVLLVEANDMPSWVGGEIPFEVHIPPIGLMYLASHIRASGKPLQIRIVETSLDCRTDEAYARILKEFRPHIVGIRSITFFLEEFQRVTRLTKMHSCSLIVAGGPIVQAHRKELFLLAPEIDIAVKGEGENSFAEIVSGRNAAEIKGIIFRQNGIICENDGVGAAGDLDSIPIPAYDLIDIDLYSNQLSYAYNHRRQGILVTSRGCLYSCTFCFKNTASFRLRSAESICREIRHLYDRHDIRDFYIVDDLFNVHPQRAISIFNRIREDGLNLRLYFSNGLRADLVSREFIDTAVRAGAIWFTYAIESANGEIQTLINKNLDLQKARAAIEYTQSLDVAVNISTMFGFPTETMAMAMETLEWLGTLPKPSLLPYHFCLRCFPGCRIAEQALEAGWSPELIEWGPRMSYNDPPLGTPSLTRSEMYRILIEYHERFGLRNRQAIREAVRVLRSVGYSEKEIAHMYSVLMHKIIDDAKAIL